MPRSEPARPGRLSRLRRRSRLYRYRRDLRSGDRRPREPVHADLPRAGGYRLTEFIHRRLDVAFALGEGSFGEDGTANTITMSGLRVSASVVKAGGTGVTNAQIRIFGMKLADMNKLSTLGKPVMQDRRNSIAVSAGVAGGGMSLLFTGNISQAWADLNSSPQAAFIVLAFDGGNFATMPIPANTWKGSIDVATIM